LRAGRGKRGQDRVSFPERAASPGGEWGKRPETDGLSAGNTETSMKGNSKLLDTLNSLLADELTAINQYMVHAEICDNWGYDRLHEIAQKRAVDEMKHAERLIGRIIFLEGQPVVSVLRPMSISTEVPKQFAGDLGLEMGAVKAYNDAIKLAGDVSDFATREILEDILNDEDRHVDVLEENLDQIKHMGLQVYLSQQIKE
jgi:bacterioferritin